jgi:NitT/TauT family transport system substrate-binding protein
MITKFIPAAMKLSRCCGVVVVLLSTSLLAASAWAENLKVRVGVIPVLGASSFFVADKEGWLHDAGLDLSILTFDSGPNIIQAAAGGNVDLYVAGVAPLAFGHTKGIDFRVVAATAVDENVLVASPGFHSYFKPDLAPATAFKKFHSDMGRPVKIATQPPNSVPAANLQYWLREVVHVDPTDVQVISMGIDATQQALLAGAVDAATVREPTLTIVQQRNPDIALIAKGEDLFPGQPGTVVAVLSTFLQQHPQAVQAIVDNIVRATAELQKNPDRAVPAITAALSKGIVDASTIRKSLSSPATHFVVDPGTIVKSTRALLAFQVKLGVVPEAPDVDGLFDRSFYAKAALRQKGANN